MTNNEKRAGGPEGARASKNHHGFTLLELATTIVALILVLGLMVSLAHYVRNELATEVTKDLLHRLDSLVDQYMQRHEGRVPQVPAFIPPGAASASLPDEQTLQQTAIANNRGIVQALRQDGLLVEQSFGGLPESIINEMMVRDAWGSPIVFMPQGYEGIGMALENRPFFFSAGGDMRYLTIENNLYSYEK